jgi:hypothetical protein
MHFFAYIDPGVGPVIWQSIIGVCVGMLFFLKKVRQCLERMICKALGIRPKPQNPPVNLPVEKEKMEADHL